MSKTLKPLFLVIAIFAGMYYLVKRQTRSFKKFDLIIDNPKELETYQTLPTGQGITRQHALHFYELFLNILLNKHNKFAEHSENVYLLNYILRNDIKWRVTESAIFSIFDVTGNEYINKKEFESFLDLFPKIGDRRLLEGFHSVIDRNIDTKIVRNEWFQFCNKFDFEVIKQNRNLRPKLIQDIQEWEQNHQSQLPNPKNIHAQFTAKTKEERNNRDLIHGQLDRFDNNWDINIRALDMLSEGFSKWVNHYENNTPHTIDDPDMFVRRLGYWILNRFERWDSLYMWIYQLLDDDGNGLMDPNECFKQFKTFDVPVFHVKEIYEYLDEDGDGVIQRDEWKDWSETIRKLLASYFKEFEPKMDNYQ